MKGVALSCTKADMEEAFGNFEGVIELRVIKDVDKESSRSFAFISFACVGDAKRVMDSNARLHSVVGGTYGSERESVRGWVGGGEKRRHAAHFLFERRV